MAEVTGKDRESRIIRASVIGIAANILLAGFKAVVGLLSNSIAIVLDAVNNFTDAGSSIITIVGTKLAGKKPDRKHPFGYGRIEYLSAMIISVIVLYAGVTSLIESVKHVINPQEADYGFTSLLIVSVAVVVKIVLGLYVKGVGKSVNSGSLVNSGSDALLDSVISLSTLIAAGIYLIWHVSLEAYLGIIISLLIIKSGIEMLRETISKLLGEHNDPEIAKNIKATVNSFPDVKGAYDLVLNNYGPDTWNGSLHIEVPDTYTAPQLDGLLREIQMAVYKEHKVQLTAIGVYSVNTKDSFVMQSRDKVQSIVRGHKNIKQMHGFYIDQQKKYIRFDIVVSFDEKDRMALYESVCGEVSKEFPGYDVMAGLDIDFSGQ